MSASFWDICADIFASCACSNARVAKRRTRARRDRELGRPREKSPSEKQRSIGRGQHKTHREYVSFDENMREYVISNHPMVT